jgi:hypothetical protein
VQPNARQLILVSRMVAVGYFAVTQFLRVIGRPCLALIGWTSQSVRPASDVAPVRALSRGRAGSAPVASQHPPR